MKETKKATGKMISVILSLLMVLSCFSGLSMTAFAAAETWSIDKTFSSDKTYDDEIIVNNDMTLTLDGCDVTINGGIYAEGKTLTIKGTGALYVTGVRKTGSQTMGHALRGNIIVDGAKLIATGDDRGYGILGSLEVKGDAWVEIYGGDGGDPQSAGQGSAGGAGVSKDVTVNGGTLLVSGGNGGNGRSDVTKLGGGGANGIIGNLTVNGGAFVTVTGGNGGNGSNGANGGLGNFAVSGTLTVNSGTVNATGGNGGNNKSNNAACAGAIIAAIRKESSNGSSWSDISGDKSTLQYIKADGHSHNFTYSVNGATITATCSSDGCPLTDKKATLTIAAPESLTYNGSAKAAVITDANKIQGAAKVQYQTKSGSSYGESTETAPTNAGTYKASITLGEGTNAKTASVEYTIAKANPTYTVPTGLYATYGDKLADVTLPDGWAWVDDTTSVGSVGTKTFKANFTPADTTNYNVVKNIDVTVKVNKAANPATVAGTASVVKGGNTVDLSNNVTMNGATGTVTYEIVGEADGCTLSGSVLTTGSIATTVIVNVNIAADDNYNALETKQITVTVANKLYQNITTENVTATYGDTNKAVSATTDGDGAISYRVVNGEDCIDIDASTGAITIKKVGQALVIVKAAETATYNEETAKVLVTVNKADSSPATVEAKRLVFNDKEQELVSVSGEAVGGEMQYALGEDAENAPEEGWSSEIPAGTDIDTYYVWYKVVGDENHNDCEPACVEATITDLIGWQKIDGEWYYYNDDGTLATDWAYIDNNWYYFNEDGVMQTGWILSPGSGQWYYLKPSGAMATGWILSPGSRQWFYLKSNGAMATGWIYDNGNWYFLKSNGAMATGWVWSSASSQWYYLKSNGAMATGWIKDNGTWYYLNSWGGMRTDNLTYKGKVYRFASNGACLNP